MCWRPLQKQVTPHVFLVTYPEPTSIVSCVGPCLRRRLLLAAHGLTLLLPRDRRRHFWSPVACSIEPIVVKGAALTLAEAFSRELAPGWVWHGAREENGVVASGTGYVPLESEILTWSYSLSHLLLLMQGPALRQWASLCIEVKMRSS
jgi:hypothetical protein